MALPVAPVLPVYLVHWNAIDWCTSAVASLLGSRGVELDLVVVDNGASGGSALRAALPDEVRVLTLAENRGYAGGANAALADWADRHPDAPLAVIGSHDLHADPDALALLVRAANDDPAIGVAGPAVLGPTTSYGGRWDGARGRLVKTPPTDEVVEREWISGTCMVLRRACCDTVGVFDDTFGSYAEDVDFGLRARDRGWRVVVVPSARTWGLGTRDEGAVRLATRNDILLAAKRGGTRAYVGAVARSGADGLRGHAGALRPRHRGAQRAASRRLANDRLVGVLRALDPHRVAGALRAARLDAGHDARYDTATGLHVVFLSHEAHRSGAPVVLLTLLRWLGAHSSTRCSVVVAEHGPMVDEFGRAATVHRLAGPTPGLGRLVRRLGLPSWCDAPRWIRARTLRRRIGAADVIYANTMTSATALRLLGYSGPVVAHVHELPGAIRRRVPPRDLAVMLARVDQFVAVSDAVADGLVRAFGVDASRVQVVHGFLERSLLDPPRGAAEMRAHARDALGLDPAAFVVGGAGRADWAKGADRFVEVASRVRGTGGRDRHRFLWIGPVKAGDLERMRADASAAGVDDLVTFVGERLDAPECFAAFDVLALTSREDSFPLVVLECAALGVPTVCFDDGGGAPEFVGDGGGIVVPPSDLDAFAHALTRLAHEPDTRTRLGHRARDLASTKHSVDELAPQILEIVERTRRRAAEFS